MLALERMQRFSFRLADLTCSVIAFTAAYQTLLPARNVLQRFLPAYLVEGGDLFPAVAGKEIPPPQDLSWIFVIAALAVSITVEYANDSRPVRIRSYINIFFIQLAATGVAAVVIGTIFYAFQVALYSRLFVVSHLAWLFILTAGYRVITKALAMHYHKAGGPRRRVVIAGRADGIGAFLSTMAPQKVDIQNDILGCLTDDGVASVPLEIPVLGNVSSLGDLLIHEPIDEVIVVLPNGDSPWLATALQHCDYFRVTVHMIHESLMRAKLDDLTAFSRVQPCASVMLVPEEELNSYRLVFKRLIDVVLSFAALVALSPSMLLIAAAIKITTPHLSVLYKWHVVGYRGRRFTGYKFTTMIKDADERKEALSALNEMSGPVFKIRNDPRVTPLGRFLRKYSLNELPQLWSVLVGDMSLVGPRPAGPHELLRYALWHKRKLSVRPGITCFWQIRGRNIISNFDDWVRMDLEYIEKRSVRTDMAILVQTLSAVVRGTGT
jgi:exopolysaccharide biosynthesis polyprenyl glycosylphosphotransferase